MKKIWLKSYPKGVPEFVNPDQYESLVDLFKRHVQKFSQAPAFENFGVALSFQQLDQLSDQLAAFFQNVLQLKKGDRIAIMLPNLLQYPITLFAALKAGLVVVNVNPLYTAPELGHQMRDAKPRAIVILENFAATLESVLPESGIEFTIISKIGDLLGFIKGNFFNFALKYLKNKIFHYHIPSAYSFKKALLTGKATPFKPVNITQEDIAFLQYTGGTTGNPKGAMLSHRNIIANVLQCISWLGRDMVDGDEMVLGALPFYHIFALTVCCFCFFVLGANCLLITNPKDLDGLIKNLKKHTPSVIVAVNTLLNGLLNHVKFSSVDFAKLKLTVAGGMAVQACVAERWQKLTGKPVIEGYGLTEASPVISINPLTLREFKDSIGLPVPSTDVSIRNSENQELGINEVGELCVQGPQVMLGYWNNVEETKKVLDDQGWLYTGDLVKIDEAGYIYLVDRKKDMIIVSGFNVYPNEVEAVIAAHPLVYEVAVIGIPDEKTGEAVKAFIVRKNSTLTESMVVDFAHQSLTRYKVPKYIEFVDSLPKSNVGKVLRKALRPNVEPRVRKSSDIPA